MKRTDHDYSVTLEEGEQLYEDASLKAIGRIESAGLVLPSRPFADNGEYFDGRLPPNVSSFTNSELGEIYSMMCQHADYVHSLLTQAKAETLNSQEKLKLAKSLVRKTKTGTVQAKEDLTVADARYVEANVRWIEAKTFFELLEGIAGAASRDLRFLSRLIETKRLDIEMNRRDTNLAFGRHPNKRSR